MQLLENLNLLIVEDMESTRRMIGDMVRCLGAGEIYTAGNGLSALKLLKEKKIDIILSDWEMPLLNGIKLLHAVREDPDLRQVRFIMLTAANDKKAVVQASQKGVDNYLIKPVRIETLAEKLKICLAGDHPYQMDLYHLNIGDYSQGAGNLHQAINHYERALSHNPENPQAHLSMGETQHKLGDLHAAMESLRESIRLNNHCAQAHFTKSMVHIDLDEPKEAQGEFDIAIELDPQDLKRCTAVARAFLAHGYVDEATSAFKIALDLDPHDAVLYNKMGIALRKCNRFEEALEQYKKALALRPDDPTLLFNMSKAYLSLEMNLKAKETLKRVLEINPDFKEAEELLVSVG